MKDGELGNYGPSYGVACRWMLFVDGENLTIRGQDFAKSEGIPLKDGPHFRRDTFLWLPGFVGTRNLMETVIPIQSHASRAYYYTSLVGDEVRQQEVVTALHDIGFTPRVFKKPKRDQKAKGVDIMLAIDVLGHGYQNHYDAILLVAGDGDYVPLVEEVKRLGKSVYVAFPRNHGLNEKLRLAADRFFDFNNMLRETWVPK